MQLLLLCVISLGPRLQAPFETGGSAFSAMEIGAFKSVELYQFTPVVSLAPGIAHYQQVSPCAAGNSNALLLAPVWVPESATSSLLQA